METYEKTYPFWLNAEELHSARLLRILQVDNLKNAREQLKDDSKFKQTLTLSVSDSTRDTGRRDLGHWQIDANDFVHTSARHVCESLEQLLKEIIANTDHIDQHQVYQDHAMQTAGLGTPDAQPQGPQTDDVRRPGTQQGTQTMAVHNEDAQTQANQSDVVQKKNAQTQATCITESTVSSTQTETVPSDTQSQQPSSWNSSREALIRSSVKDVAFTVDDASMSLDGKDKLQCQFPGNITTSLHPNPSVHTKPEASDGTQLADTVDLPDAVPSELSAAAKSSEALLTPTMSVRNSEDSFEHSTSVTTTDMEGGMRSRRQTQTPIGGSRILDYADELRLGITGHERMVIPSLYGNLRLNSYVAPYKKKSGTIEKYYDRLLSLYILAYKQEEYSLAYVVLLRFQSTMCPEKRSMPPVKMALRAFHFLPSHAPFCQWIAIVYCFLWPTREDGTYAEFQKDHPGFDKATQARLFYDVAYYRDPYVYGNDAGVISSWCDVHDHARHTPEEIALCRSMKKDTNIKEQDVVQDETESSMKRVQGGFKKIDPKGISYIRSDDAIAGTSIRNKKRKPENSPEKTSQNKKRKAEDLLGKRSQETLGEGPADSTAKKRRGRPPGWTKKGISR